MRIWGDTERGGDDIPATFACPPDSTTLELDGFLANLEGEGIVVRTFLLGGEDGGEVLALCHDARW
jgi:hypothetical protein